MHVFIINNFSETIHPAVTNLFLVGYKAPLAIWDCSEVFRLERMTFELGNSLDAQYTLSRDSCFLPGNKTLIGYVRGGFVSVLLCSFQCYWTQFRNALCLEALKNVCISQYQQSNVFSEVSFLVLHNLSEIGCDMMAIKSSVLS